MTSASGLPDYWWKAGSEQPQRRMLKAYAFLATGTRKWAESRDFLRDALLRWITLVLAALSSAELSRRYTALASSACLAATAARNFLSRVCSRDLIDLFCAPRRRLARACFAAERVLAMINDPMSLLYRCSLNGAPSYVPTCKSQRGKLCGF